MQLSSEQLTLASQTLNHWFSAWAHQLGAICFMLVAKLKNLKAASYPLVQFMRESL